ncbi:MAG: hypothetical protein CM15mP23_18850 [Cryomorphaceae bacterium]|nr:MAG: hypothetical protein CM15mP23_18850 [Cryomorphaceae bacterium]
MNVNRTKWYGLKASHKFSRKVLLSIIDPIPRFLHANSLSKYKASIHNINIALLLNLIKNIFHGNKQNLHPFP